MDLKKTRSFVRKTPSYTKNVVLLGGSTARFWSHYFRNRRFPADQEFYVVYTSIDHGIPFQPDSALVYWLINVKFIPTSVKLGDALPRGSFDAIRRAYVYLAEEAVAAFRDVPTIMPHFTEHNGRALQAAQTLLKPINCSPSLHTATPFLGYNLGAKYLPETEPELRRHVGDVISTIIKIKAHALIDVAFGLFLCKKTVEDKLGLDFCDLEAFFTGEQKSRDGIPYEHLYRMYHEVLELEKAWVGGESGLSGIMERYFQETGLPRVRREQSNCLYDLEQKKLVYTPELTVGKGLV